MRDWLFLCWQEKQVYDDPEYFNLCAGEQAKLLEPVYSKWRKWLSEENWNKYYEEHEARRVADSIREPTQQELEEEERLVERENAEEEAKDAKFLKEKSDKEKIRIKYSGLKDPDNFIGRFSISIV
jgi:hypothetical protein